MPDAAEPAANPGVPAYVTKRVREILEREQLWRFLPKAPEHRLRVEAVLEPGLSLAAAHLIWQQTYLSTLPGVSPLANQPANAVTAAGIVRVSCEWVCGVSGGMSSYHGFRGFFVSLLVSTPEGCVWDSRVEPPERAANGDPGAKIRDGVERGVEADEAW